VIEPTVEAILVRIETKLDIALSDIEDHEHRIRKIENSGKPEDHEVRLRKLEQALWLSAGIATAVGGGIGTVVSIVLYIVGAR
jgi:hypothetical protein